MDRFIAWCAFFGGWLLVAGPIFQAAVELREEDAKTDEIEAHTDSLRARFPEVSPWWWLLPPVHYFLSRRRSRAVRIAVMETLEPEQLRALISFINKATGWMLVAGGAFLIAVKETWELVEAYHWPHWLFWTLCVVMVMACATNTAVNVRRTAGVLGLERPADPGAHSAHG